MKINYNFYKLINLIYFFYLVVDVAFYLSLLSEPNRSEPNQIKSNRIESSRQITLISVNLIIFLEIYFSSNKYSNFYIFLLI